MTPAEPQRSTGGRAVDAGAAVITGSSAVNAVHWGGAAVGQVAMIRDARKMGSKLAARHRGAPPPAMASAVGKTGAVPRVAAKVAPTATKALNSAGKAAASLSASPAGNMLKALADSKVVGAASKVAMPLLAFRAGMNALSGYQADGMRGAGRGIVQTLDPTGLVSKLAGGDGRGVLERGYDLAFGRQPVVGAYLDEQARGRTEAHEIAQAEKVDRMSGTRQAAPDDKGGNGQVKAYTRKDGTPVAGYARTPGMGI